MSSDPTFSNTLRLEVASWQTDHDILRKLREQVFVREQSVPADIEWNGQDENCIHILAYINGLAIGCGRLMSDGKVGRMAVLPEYRKHGVGSAILEKTINTASVSGLKHLYLHAQEHAVAFYRKAGFEAKGNSFEEAGITHVLMHRILTPIK